MGTYSTYCCRQLKCVLIVELIPRPARSCEDPPLYLRLKMGKPLNKKIPHSTPLMSYGKKKMRPEYWFSVPKNRVDELYKFIQAWVPQLYGELDEEKVMSCLSTFQLLYRVFKLNYLGRYHCNVTIHKSCIQETLLDQGKWLAYF